MYRRSAGSLHEDGTNHNVHTQTGNTLADLDVEERFEEFQRHPGPLSLKASTALLSHFPYCRLKEGKSDMQKVRDRERTDFVGKVGKWTAVRLVCRACRILRTPA
jgi:hypothetical protein